MNWLKNLAQVLESEGGRVIAAFVLLAFAGFWFAIKLPKAEDVMMAALTLIAREMMSDRDRQKPA